MESTGSGRGASAFPRRGRWPAVESRAAHSKEGEDADQQSDQGTTGEPGGQAGAWDATDGQETGLDQVMGWLGFTARVEKPTAARVGVLPSSIVVMPPMASASYRQRPRLSIVPT